MASWGGFVYDSSRAIGILFAAAFSLGRLYADNELTVVFGSGISLYQFLAPLVLVGMLEHHPHCAFTKFGGELAGSCHGPHPLLE